MSTRSPIYYERATDKAPHLYYDAANEKVGGSVYTIQLPRHDDLDNPPDYTTLRDDYWLLWDLCREMEIRLTEISNDISPEPPGHPDNPWMADKPN